MRTSQIIVTQTDVGWKVSGTVKGKQRRKQFSGDGAKELAIATKQDWEREIADMPALPMSMTRLTPEQSTEAESAFHRLAGHALTLTTAVDYALANYKHTNRSLSVMDGIELFIAEKRSANRAKRTVSNLKSRLNLLKLAVGSQMQVNQVNAELCRTLIFRDGSSPRNRINDSLALTNFFTWACAQGFASVNPMDRLQDIKADDIEPQILTNADVRRLLLAAQAHKGGKLVPYVVLGTFCAIRPEELARLSRAGAWAEIDLDAKTVTLGPKITKLRARRIVAISDNAVSFLLPHVTKKTAIVGPNWRKDWEAVRLVAGFNGKDTETTRAWVSDYMRHTGISHHLAKHNNEGQTASWAGNSPDVIHKHYKGLVKPKDTVEFWDIRPDNLAGSIIDLKAHAA